MAIELKFILTLEQAELVKEKVLFRYPKPENSPLSNVQWVLKMLGLFLRNQILSICHDENMGKFKPDSIVSDLPDPLLEQGV